MKPISSKFYGGIFELLCEIGGICVKPPCGQSGARLCLWYSY